MNQPLEIILAQPRGFCAGVVRAIDIVERALQLYGAPVYVRHEIVHNKWVVEDLKSKGVVFVKEVTEIPDGGITVFSAHGISEKVENMARLRELPVIDATCPLVTKVHNEAQRYEKDGLDIILIGHAGHPEVEGTMGRVKGRVYLVGTVEEVVALQVADESKLAFVTQTTLSVDDTREVVDALRQRFPAIQGPDVKDICYATQNRQNAVKDLAKLADIILVVGAPNSSNSNRLRDLGEELGVPAYLINDASEIQESWLIGKQRAGITAGASAPEHLVEGVIARLQQLRLCTVKGLDGVQENVVFKLPPEVREPLLRQA
jgi:4-hydroxy-3-methylbut-2-en-1-yl diphosphate reductase